MKVTKNDLQTSVLQNGLLQNRSNKVSVNIPGCVGDPGSWTIQVVRRGAMVWPDCRLRKAAPIIMFDICGCQWERAADEPPDRGSGKYSSGPRAQTLQKLQGIQ